MPLVLDASAALAWFFEDENGAPVDPAFDWLLTHDVVVPCIWPLEVANSLLASQRRGWHPLDEVTEVVARVLDLPISVEDLPLGRALGPVLALAAEYGLTAYDAAYLELAMRTDAPLLSLDNALRDAATRAGVDVL